MPTEAIKTLNHALRELVMPSKTSVGACLRIRRGLDENEAAVYLSLIGEYGFALSAFPGQRLEREIELLHVPDAAPTDAAIIRSETSLRK
jgi:hypothetical protein